MNINSIELFAGAGGLALGLEKAGFENILLNEFNKDACNTLITNRPNWNVVKDDIKNVDFTKYNNKVHLLTGGFPCQAFSHSGKRLGFEDTRGTLFYEFARAIKEVSPICFLAENVKGLLSHDSGNTLKTIINTFSDLGYHVFTPKLLNANDYHVAQNRERIFIFGVRAEYKDKFRELSPIKSPSINLEDILVKKEIYPNPITNFSGTPYSEKKKYYFEKIPQGGCWRNLDIEEQKIYMGKMFYSGGGKTGILKRLSMSKPSVTLLTSPSQKQTERCHPLENRPINIRESARIQSFPDEWIFSGSVSSQYKQIGNAVPVNLAYAVALDVYKQIENILKQN